MSSEEKTTTLFKRLSTQRGRLLMAMLVDMLFLALWAGLQFLSDWICGKIELNGFSDTLLLWFQYTFGIATLVPVVVFLFVDISKIVIKGWKDVYQELDN